MSNQEHLDILAQGVEASNAWRQLKIPPALISVMHAFREPFSN